VSDHSTLRPETRPSSTNEPATENDLISIDTVESALATVREGLPRNYRMRADRHYVDLLASPAAGQPIRAIALNDLDAAALPAQTDLRGLVDSIRALGVVQPLLVRRRETRYSVIAGRKRFAAAQLLRLAAVPCVVHDVDDEKASALAIADNLRPEPAAPVAGASTTADPVQRTIAQHLATITHCVNMSIGGVPALGPSMLNMVRAHAWRAARLIDASDIIAAVPFPVRRERAVASIVDEVIDGFAPECALNGVVLQPQIRDDMSSSGLNDGELLAAVAAGIIAMLPLVERAVRPTVVVRASNTTNGALMLSLSQSDAPVAERTARGFFDPADAASGPGGAAAATSARAVKALAERRGGTASFDVTANGATLTLVLGRRS
jgi:ParB/Sulfiredoxin domain